MNHMFILSKIMNIDYDRVMYKVARSLVVVVYTNRMCQIQMMQNTCKFATKKGFELRLTSNMQY